MTDTSGAAEHIRSDPSGAGTATTVPSAPPAATPAPGSKEDWTDQVTDLIVDTVDKVRSRTTGPILEIAKGSVHAVVALILVLPVVVLLTVLAVHVLTYFVFREVWITYTVLGAVLVLTGLTLWAKRRSRS